MEIETIIIETVDSDMELGEAQDAYDGYPGAVQAFREAREEWKDFTERIMSKEHVTITQQEIEESDSMYETAQRLRAQFLDMKAILHKKVDDLIIEGQTLEGDLAHYAENPAGDDGIDWAHSFLQDAVAYRDSANLLEAIQKAYRARECLKAVLETAQDAWRRRHQEKVDSLSLDGEEAHNG